jgi:DNA-binding transcriptional regulator GbsR (MarR family)
MSDASADKRSDAPADPHDHDVERFIEAWGRMGSVWGISRTMAEVHALLYISGDAMCTDDIMGRLEISRGNASMSVRALLDWGVIARVHRRGDRKEYFQAEQDIWSIFRAIVRERVKREVDPLLVSLHEIRDRTRENGGKPETDIDRRLDEMIGFFEDATRLADRFTGPSGSGLKLAASLLSASDKVVGRVGGRGSKRKGTA